MDSVNATSFSPDTNVTRGDMAVVLASDCWIRQSQINPLAFIDVPSSLAPYVQAVTSAGGPMRDTFMQGGPAMFDVVLTAASGPVPFGGPSFNPGGNVTRADLAAWLVRSLGKDADAQAAMNTPTTFTDDADIPAEARDDRRRRRPAIRHRPAFDPWSQTASA